MQKDKELIYDYPAKNGKSNKMKDFSIKKLRIVCLFQRI